MSTKKYTTLVIANPYGWVMVELADGQRLTKDLVNFDTDREDIQVNEYGVLFFYNKQTADHLLTMPDSLKDTN